ncbi:MAG: DUF1934 domain-containing protein [Bacillota bacterium]|nr:DUF1934 domain-containing protein [Bacillota bacterium]
MDRQLKPGSHAECAECALFSGMTDENEEGAKQIPIFVRSTIVNDDDKHVTEIYTTAKFRQRNGKSYITYDESELLNASEQRRTLTYRDGVVEIILFGQQTRSQIRLEIDRRHSNYYHTEYGVFEMTTMARSIVWDDRAHHVRLEYDLDISGNLSRVLIEIDEFKNGRG